LTLPDAGNSSQPPLAAEADVDFDPSGHYGLDPDVALRPEPFGALAYHYGSRRLTFLRSVLLADVVRDLEHHESVDAALSASVPEPQRPAYRKALASLAASRFIRAC
jgi:putative mycofactocin binding protein MftB